MGLLEKAPRRPDFHSIDNSIILGDPLGLIRRPSLMEWVLDGQRLCNQLQARYFRVMPVLDKQRPPMFVDYLKFTLHTLLSLGATICVVFTADQHFLSAHFGVDNGCTIQGAFSLESDRAWSEGDAYFGVREQTDHLDLYKTFQKPEWLRSNKAWLLKYGRNSFTMGVQRKENIREKYGELLGELQNGRCAISGQKLNVTGLHVDHIFPASRGGNNTLINLQAVSPRDNLEKSNHGGEANRRILSDYDLEQAGLDTHHPYTDLTARDTSVNPFGYLLL
jgi:5-methylcytosine-specific restriction endonuclease McrA